jgi:hypothetical protein
VLCGRYPELELNEIIKYRAIGGMVGLRAIKKIFYSPFTGISFRCLDGYIKAGNFTHDFRLHYLGINIDYDRFQIAFLEELFNRYLKGKSKAIHTYDSINYSRTAQMKVKNLEI